MARPPERTCDRCKRVGTVGYRPGTKPGAWVCESWRACRKRVTNNRHRIARLHQAERREALDRLIDREVKAMREERSRA